MTHFPFIPSVLAVIVGGSLTLPAGAEPVRFSNGPVLRGGASNDLVVESDSIERENSRVSWVQEAQQRDGSGSLVYRARALMLADCTNRDVQMRRELTVLVEGGREVQPYLSSGDSSPIEEVRPGTAAEQALNYVCEAMP